MNGAWIQRTVGALLRCRSDDIVGQLADALLRRNLPGTAALRRSWEATLECLRHALADPAMRDWGVMLEYPLLRVRKRADVVLLAPHAIFVLEFKTGHGGDARGAARQADDYAQDLHDFHAGCRGVPVVPIAVAAGSAHRINEPLLIWHGVAPVQHAGPEDLGAMLAGIHAAIPTPLQPVSPGWWHAQPYRPVPGIVEAARMAFARQAVPDIDAARAEPIGLRRTTLAIRRHVTQAKASGEHRIVFVSGIPGAGKTRCGLAVAFETEEPDRGVFLTGNPALVHVFREALTRDAIEAGMAAALARQRMEVRIQALPDFRDHHVARPSDIPDEHVIVVDEAQRSWSRDHAIRKTAARAVQLTDSEPGHLLDTMARHADWAVIVCLIGGGQEIHDGEGGLAEWSAALAARPAWRCAAAPDVLAGPDPRQRLVLRGGDLTDADLHLAVPMRSLRGTAVAEWVDAVLRNDQPRALASAADHTLPVFITRDLEAMRRSLRRLARGRRRAGLVGSAAAKRLRAEGLGIELPHMDSSAVARWFLDFWPDIRASDALEVLATEFSCQGLELDHVGLAWGGDLIRRDGQWLPRRFHGARWEPRAAPEAVSNRINTYRVLLTRARYETIIWVPRGTQRQSVWYDRTRDAAEMDGVADFLLACGARPLAEAMEAATPEPGPALLI